MAEENNNDRKLTLMLLQESLWGIEDKLNVISESIADHEADILRLKRQNQIFSDRLNHSNQHRAYKVEDFNGRKTEFNQNRNS